MPSITVANFFKHCKFASQEKQFVVHFLCKTKMCHVQYDQFVFGGRKILDRSKKGFPAQEKNLKKIQTNCVNLYKDNLDVGGFLFSHSQHPCKRNLREKIV